MVLSFLKPNLVVFKMKPSVRALDRDKIWFRCGTLGFCLVSRSHLNLEIKRMKAQREQFSTHNICFG